ncbi:restriction endonuclease subunit S [Bremerella alba]|uniref:Type I restriction modification DNA specificity domain-containing protein n=1 Tax=Bremerella alba TaxID=980252 RepID=A0A7V8V657_9BACT|nr:restriction endonuclease subunit S [Bremerella alba]MBA2115575.1 hypothetical protein [Bremerella alba]
MESEWQRLKLSDVGVSLIDCVHKTPADAGEGIPYIGIPQMKDGRIDFDADPRLISEADYVEWTKKANPQANDVVLSRRCNPGETAVVKAGEKFALGQNLVLLRAKTNAVFPGYLRWVTKGPEWWAQVGKFLNVGAVFDSLKCGDIPNFELTIPPHSDQKAIAHILGTLDDKIELNRRMNDTLESMAQALFKSWFVDFDPVIDNALAAGNPIPEPLRARAETRRALGSQRKPLPDEIQKLLPDAFVFDNRMGWIPDTWTAGTLEDMVILQRGFDLPQRLRIDGEVPLMVASGQDGTHNIPKVNGPGITTGRSGKLGVVNLVLRDFWPLNTTLWVKEYKNSSPYHALFLLQSLNLENFNSGSAVPTLNRNHVHNLSLPVPPKPIVKAHARIVEGLYEKILFNSEQSAFLAKLRDTLLPKLLSGELRIPDAEMLVADSL